MKLCRFFVSKSVAYKAGKATCFQAILLHRHIFSPSHWIIRNYLALGGGPLLSLVREVMRLLSRMESGSSPLERHENSEAAQGTLKIRSFTDVRCLYGG